MGPSEYFLHRGQRTVGGSRHGYVSHDPVPPDHLFWGLLALCAGTGGSLLIIGSAAGVAAMGIMHIDFVWYVKKVTFPAALGYLGGIITFWVMWH